MPEIVDGAEELSTFARFRRQVHWETLHVRPEIFTPRRKNGRLENSVYRTTELPAAEVWNICAAHFDPNQQAPAIGRGRGTAAVVLAQGLQLIIDGIPHARHTNVVGWFDDPAAPEEELKHHWKLTAQKIAAHFPYLPRPD